MNRHLASHTAHVPRQAAPLQSRPHRYLHRLLTLAAGSCILLSTASLAQPVNGNGNATSVNSHAATLPAPVAAAEPVSGPALPPLSIEGNPRPGPYLSLARTD